MIKRALVVAFAAAFLSAVSVAPTPRASAAAAAKTKQESSGPTFKERQSKCSAEWKEAKAAGKTGNAKWPKFWSDCNKRLKKQSA